MTPRPDSKVQEIFEIAVTLGDSARPEYLDRACDGDPELRGLVNELLAREDETVGLSEPTEIAPVPSAAVMECPTCWQCYESTVSACPGDGAPLRRAFQGPQFIDGKYRVERRLGRGGMGAVYLAQHLGLGKRFALKLILHEGALSRSDRESFENEARALGRLNHRNIVSVSDYGVDPRAGGVPYLVMEYLVGKTLSEVLKQRKALHFDEAISLLRAAAEAIDAAHDNGIVHGDLKPSNLFLAEEPDSSNTCLKVVDFGLARLSGPSSSAEPEEKQQTRAPLRLSGTPAYMSPELLQSGEPSTASDRFAFGVLMYETLAGSVPFGRHLAEVVKNLDKPPAAPSSRNPALPSDIDEPVLALLDSDPTRRPLRATTAVASVAQAWLRSEQRKWRASEWPKRLLLSAATALLTVLIAAGLAQLPFARVLEGRIADQRFALLPPSLPDPSLLLISIDEASLDSDQRPLTERSSEFAAMIDSLFAAGARAVAVDLLLPARWSESREFAKAVASHADRLELGLFASPTGTVIGSECVSSLTAYVLGPRKYEALFGLTNLEEEEDRTIRRATLSFPDQAGGTHRSFAARAVEAAFPGRQRAASPSAPIWIDYSMPLQSLTTVSYKDVSSHLQAAPGLFRGRMVIVGATFSSSGDEHRVPGDKLVPGQWIQAAIANTILAGNPIHEIPWWLCFSAVGLACLVAVAATLCFPHYYTASLVASTALLFAYAGLAFWIFRASRTMIAVVGPELTIVLSILAAWGLKSRLGRYPTGG